MIEYYRNKIVFKGEFKEILNIRESGDNFKIYVLSKYVAGSYFSSIMFGINCRDLCITNFCGRKKK